MSMKPISPLNAMFLLGESREHPMHVGGLQIFRPPADAGPGFIREIYDAALACTDVQPTFRKHPAFLGGVTSVAWTYDDGVELGYHVRLSALPRPGRMRDLVEMVSWLHATLLDRHRPLWESYLIEGLDDGCFAVYTKFHHALLDGVAALKLLQRSYSTDPGDDEVRTPWALPPRSTSGSGGGLPSPVRAVGSAVESVAGLGSTAWAMARGALVEHRLTVPFRAPRTMLNVPIGGARQIAVQSWPLTRIEAVRDAAGATVNDVVLAMCAGALRAFLTDHDALPEAPLIALVPVSLRSGDDKGGGNAVGAVLCNLNTHLADPAERLAGICASMSDNKTLFAGLAPVERLAFSGGITGGPAIALGPGFLGVTPPPFNIVISNVGGAPEPLYWHGAHLAANYPLSIPIDGQAMNITITSGADNCDFGLVGCRNTVPDLPRMLRHLEAALADLERAVAA
jgi:diacylglycerol O-acyltransferase